MQRIFLILFSILPIFSLNAQDQLPRNLAATYIRWQNAMVNKDFNAWKRQMATDRQVEVRNRILSEKFSFPADVFKVPVSPPPVKDLKLIISRESGVNAKGIFFGKIDFNIGGVPKNNVMVVSYKKENGQWRFVKGEYINLERIPEVREQIENKDYTYFDQPEFQPSEYKRKNSVQVLKQVPIIAKVYAYCPNREAKVVCHNVSNRLFQNPKASEVIIGGAKPGKNQVKISINTLPGGLKNEPMTVRVYLLSQVEGVKPIKAYEYLVKEGEQVKQTIIDEYVITPSMINSLLGK